MAGQKLVAWQNDGIDSILKNVEYGECRPNQSGLGKSCNMNFVENGTPSKLVVQTPKMFAPFGAKEWEAKEPGKSPKWDLVLNFKGGSTSMKTFSDLIKGIDELNITYAFDNQEAFFGESGKSREIIADRYSPMHNNKDPKYDPKLNTKLDVRQGQYQGQIYDPKENLQGLDFVTPQSYIQALIEFGSMWVVDKRFGMTVRTIQLMVHQQEQIKTLAITPMDTDEDPATHKDDASYSEYE
tara:strand:- start:3171 stop:3890 length:720 start_codon:yes stop_codon:yes gene_type:complete